jgi:hypothetical protein
MPELRNPGRRDLAAAPAVQFDPVASHGNAYQNQRRRDNAARTAASYPARTPRPRPKTRDGYPVTVRNSLPFRPYRYRGSGRDLLEEIWGHDITECTCHA